MMCNHKTLTCNLYSSELVTIFEVFTFQTRPLLLTSTMDLNSNQGASNHGNNRGSNCDSNEPANPIINSHARVTPTTENPRGYSLFEMSLVSNYTNNQIIYYYVTGAIPAAELSCFHQFMKQQK